MNNEQQILSQDQINAFCHDLFVEDQVRDFIALLGASINSSSGKIVDVGGGYGFFASAIQNRMNLLVRVLDTDTQSIDFCKQNGIEAAYGDALNPAIIGDENLICFNLILHHLVGKSEDETRNLQGRALSVWSSNARAIFVNEYIYESFVVNNISGWLIFQITSSSILSMVGRFIAKFIPSLQANTFGVGVRFRSHEEWRGLFASVGFDVIDTVIGKEESISLPRRLLLIKSCRRDSFLLKPQPSMTQK